MTARRRHPIVVCEAHPGASDAVSGMLDAEGFLVHRSTDDETLIEATASHAPRAIVYVLAHDLGVDIALLQLLRRVVPDVPLVLIGAPHPTLAARLAPVHPVHVTHAPFDAHVLGSALRDAIASHGRMKRNRARGERAVPASTAPAGRTRAGGARDGTSRTRDSPKRQLAMT